MGALWAAASTARPPSPPPSARGPHDREVERATAAASASLARRPHSRAELAAKLARRGVDPRAAAAALDRLATLGVQSDAEFAAAFVRGKWRAGLWAPGRIAGELAARGVDRAHRDEALASVFGAPDARLLAPKDDPDEALDALDAALVHAAARQAALSRGAPAAARKRRLVNWLARRGHRWGTISAVLAEVGL